MQYPYANFIQQSFSNIANRYDSLNSLLSFGLDRYWRWQTVRELRSAPPGEFLDLCGGTMPLALALTRRYPKRQVVCLDFCAEMLHAGLKKPEIASSQRLLPLCGDAQELPFADDGFAGITVGFGVRNLSDLHRGIREMRRILRPGGRLVILEFSRPDNPFFKPLYGFYKNLLLPVIAGVLSGDREAYAYLASSIEGFLPQNKLLRVLTECGFAGVKARPLSLGIVTVYTGIVAD
ncbi:ubiquinone/menaquinone biosynthesis methyltransferase [bacterium]|nr:ubiquinone/menaquinone biosynthesis methyltransferase [bacterium]